MYNLNSKIECAKLIEWYIGIKSLANEVKSVVLFLGNTEDGNVQATELK